MLYSSQPVLKNFRPQLMNQGLMKKHQMLRLHQPVQCEQQRVPSPTRLKRHQMNIYAMKSAGAC
nr:MAG TPA: hypothetical protein [Caudoviricetes sp.]